MANLPKTLEHEPLVDAVFEVRLSGSLPLADILPGFLLHDIGGGTTVSRLPAAEIPFPMRKEDPNLQFAPIQRVEVDDFFILIGDRNVIVSCKLPYPKWPRFRRFILETIARLGKLDLIGAIERYSVKYVNLIQAPTFQDQIRKISMDIKLGDVEVSSEHVTLQVHRREEDVVHILSVSTGAHGKIDGRSVSGVLVDIDSIRNVNFPDLKTLSIELEPGLESLRQANKEKFFACLTEETISGMGPTYE
ncbi:TIGR04255 family protein [Jannaschia pohangensis]|uniref:TIGR04255 family protein n=1 Tax=Jannaschia pohangensis TaxID=390807 RepID=A0A1I3NM43_9RHOB|nr:TIGR04255 family protein [Jannaschia pohangensis]SFJ10030.1 TIGR04255 family protein [Jannaschia pohangensis]